MAGPSELLVAALDYAARGWRVFPVHTPSPDSERPCSCGTPSCESVGKHPRIMGWKEQATCDRAQIEKWWGMWAEANVGIACGQQSNLWALDIDGREGLRTLSDRKAAGLFLP